MINKKLSRIIGPAAGVMVFMMSTGLIPVQAYAAETKSVHSETSLSNSENMNYEIEQNGVKLKIKDIIGTKNRIKINAAITREDGFDENIYSHRNLIYRMYMEKSKTTGGGSSWYYPDEKTIEIDVEEKSEEGFPEQGNIRADLVLGEYDFNGSIVIPVDFTESFKQYMKKDLDIRLNEYSKIIGFESDAIGTRIIISRSIDDSGCGIYYDKLDPYFIIKAGNKMYSAANVKSTVFYSEDDESYTCAYEAEGLTYNDIIVEDNISFIPIKCTLTSDEIEDNYKDVSFYEKLSKELVVSNNIKYNKEIEFSDGTKGEIKAERVDNKIKMYCSSDSDIKSFILAESLSGEFTEGTDNYINSIFENDKVIYKDENTENQYVAEFKDSYPEKMFEIYMDTLLLNWDKFNIGDEIKIK